MSRKAAIYHQQRAREGVSRLLQALPQGDDSENRAVFERQRAIRMIRNHFAMSRVLRVS